MSEGTGPRAQSARRKPAARGGVNSGGAKQCVCYTAMRKIDISRRRRAGNCASRPWPRGTPWSSSATSLAHSTPSRPPAARDAARPWWSGPSMVRSLTRYRLALAPRTRPMRGQTSRFPPAGWRGRLRGSSLRVPAALAALGAMPSASTPQLRASCVAPPCFPRPLNALPRAGDRCRSPPPAGAWGAGGLKRCRVRSVAWRVFFGLLPLDKPVTDWKAIVESQREQYAAIKAENTLDPTEVGAAAALPLPPALTLRRACVRRRPRTRCWTTRCPRTRTARGRGRTRTGSCARRLARTWSASTPTAWTSTLRTRACST